MLTLNISLPYTNPLLNQWRIHDFPKGRQPKSGKTNLLFGRIVAKNQMNIFFMGLGGMRVPRESS